MNFFHFNCILHRNSYKNSFDPDQTPHYAASDFGSTLFAYVPKTGFRSIRELTMS